MLLVTLPVWVHVTFGDLCCSTISVVKMLLNGEVGGCALNSHGNYIVDHGKSWNCVFEFMWEPWTCDFQQCGIFTSVDLDEPVQPPFKLRISK